MTTDDQDDQLNRLPFVDDLAGVVDVQIHVWLTDRPSRPWIPDPWSGRSEHAQQVFKHQLALSCSAETALDEIGVAGVTRAVLAPLGVYGYDCSLELAATRNHPDQLYALASIDHRGSHVREALRRMLGDGFRGVRFAPMDWRGLDRGDYESFFQAAAEVGCPVFLNFAHPLPDAFLSAVQNYRSIPFVIDHLGVGSAPPVQLAGPEPFQHLPSVLRFASEPNVYLKLTSAPALSRQKFPFRDIWPSILQLVHAFGAERIMWGSDFTRTNCLYSYRDGLQYLWALEGLAAPDREQIVGGTVRRLLGIDASGGMPSAGRAT